MSGVKWLYISNKSEVFKITQPKNRLYKAIKELSGQEVLKVVLFYETKDRKPNQLISVEFDRIRLDSEGAYELNGDEMQIRMQNAFNFTYATPQVLAKREGPFVLPVAPIIPSSKEKMALYNYLEKKFPVLGIEAPLIVENKIQRQKNIHHEHIDMIKEAKRLRRA